MIDLYYWTTPNGHKVTMFLEEAGVPYRIVPVNISTGEQFKPDFLKISPNNRMPAIVDDEPAEAGPPLSVFESGAILLYLAEKTGQFIPKVLHGRADVLQWLFWQMGGLGPMAGQNHHFSHYAPDKLPYAIGRYVNETNRLYGVLNRRLADREFLAGDYSIADMASYPWIVPHERQGQKLEDFPHLKRWFDAIWARPAVKRAYARAKEINTQPTVSEEAKKILFGQTAAIAAR
jgi:GSH-dependent disulfide-bond oxidoreductase